MIFDATLYANKPATVMQKISYINGNEAMRRAFYGVSNAPVCLDTEPFSNAQRLSILTDFRALHPGIRVGMYGTLPQGNYWDAIAERKSSGFQSWNAMNDTLIELSHSVDIVYPSLYTFYDDRVGWLKYAMRNINQAWKYNKTVYPFLWPQYHDSSVKALQYIPADYFKMQIETCLDLCGGVVIWGGWDFANSRAAQWDDSAPWYDVVRDLT